MTRYEEVIAWLVDALSRNQIVHTLDIYDASRFVEAAQDGRRSVDLTDEELGLIDEALDSYEYWEFRDLLPHDSGHITVFDDQDFEGQLRNSFEDQHEEMREAWAAVRSARALADKLNAVTKQGEGKTA